MTRTWQTEEVIRHLSEGNHGEWREILEEAQDEAAEALQEWVHAGNAPKSLYDSVLQFTTDPNHAFDPVDWDEVIAQIAKNDEEEPVLGE